jgi:hypothetical protein
MKIAGSGSVNRRYRSADPDPYQNVTDPATMMSIMDWICSVHTLLISAPPCAEVGGQSLDPRIAPPEAQLLSYSSPWPRCGW